MRTKSVSEIKNNGTEYGIKLVYSGYTLKLTGYPQCHEYTGRTTSRFDCGLFWINRCEGTYAHYACKANYLNDIASIERAIKGTTRIVKSLRKGWKYNDMISRRVIVENSKVKGIRKRDCYKFKEYGPQQVCLNGIRTSSCYGIKDYGLQKICHDGAIGNACYGLKDYARQKVCQQGVRSRACDYISNYNARKSCKTFNGSTEFWLIMDHYGYYTWP